MSQPKPDLKAYTHLLYEASVQGVESDLYFANRVYKRKNGRRPITIREDFCGTANLACQWVEYDKKNRAWGVDLDQPTLDFGQQHNVAKLGDFAKNITLIHGDVRTAETPPVDMLFALNFSFCLFRTREELRTYFAHAHTQLAEGGLFVTDIYGGTEAITPNLEEKIVAGFTAPDGTEIPDFTYSWDQSSYNVVTNECMNYIHFDVPGFGKIKNAFTYDWRLWTIAEIREIMIEAGFSDSEAYIHGFNDQGESDETWRLRKNYENAEGWIAYVIGIR